MGSIYLNFQEMIDMALGSTNLGTINFQMLHTLLQCIVHQLNLITAVKIQYHSQNSENIKTLTKLKSNSSPEYNIEKYNIDNGEESNPNAWIRKPVEKDEDCTLRDLLIYHEGGTHKKQIIVQKKFKHDAQNIESHRSAVTDFSTKSSLIDVSLDEFEKLTSTEKVKSKSDKTKSDRTDRDKTDTAKSDRTDKDKSEKSNKTDKTNPDKHRSDKSQKRESDANVEIKSDIENEGIEFTSESNSETSEDVIQNVVDLISSYSKTSENLVQDLETELAKYQPVLNKDTKALPEIIRDTNKTILDNKNMIQKQDFSSKINSRNQSLTSAENNPLPTSVNMQLTSKYSTISKIAFAGSFTGGESKDIAVNICDVEKETSLLRKFRKFKDKIIEKTFILEDSFCCLQKKCARLENEVEDLIDFTLRQQKEYMELGNNTKQLRIDYDNLKIETKCWKKSFKTCQSVVESHHIDIQMLKNTKADQTELKEVEEMKEDKSVVATKVPFKSFEIVKRDLYCNIVQIKEKTNTDLEIIQQILKDVQTNLDKKVDNGAMDTSNKIMNRQIYNLENKIDKIVETRICPESCGTVKYLQDVKCMVCNEKVQMKTVPDESVPNASATIKNNTAALVAATTKRSMKEILTSRYCGGPHTIIRPQEKLKRLAHFGNNCCERFFLKPLPLDVPVMMPALIEGNNGVFYRADVSLLQENQENETKLKFNESKA